jgi:hypothetical protein
MKRKGKFTIYKDIQKQYRFNLKGSNGRIIVFSEGYHNKKDCVNGISVVKEWAIKYTKDSAQNYIWVRKSKNEQYYFVIKSTNGKKVAISETYKTLTAAKHGQITVSEIAADAKIVNTTGFISNIIKLFTITE